MIALFFALLAPQAVTTPMPSPSPTAKQDRIVCRYVTSPNSRLGQRTCKTAAEWNAQRMDPDARRKLDDAMVRRGTTG